MAGQQHKLSVFSGQHKGVTVYFLHNAELFPSAYSDENGASHYIKQIALFANATLDLLLLKHSDVSLIITNDWFTGFIPAYLKIKEKYSHSAISGAKTFHITHNLGSGYKGKITPRADEGTLHGIHELPDECIIDRMDAVQPTLNPSKVVFTYCDNWGTVSNSYKFELLKTSSLSALLSKFPNAFSYPNGLNVKERKEILETKVGLDHHAAKKQIMLKYFNIEEFNDAYPLFGFVGRITEQKGVHLILECIENIIFQNNRKVYVKSFHFLDIALINLIFNNIY